MSSWTASPLAENPVFAQGARVACTPSEVPGVVMETRQREDDGEKVKVKFGPAEAEALDLGGQYGYFLAEELQML